MGNDPTTGWACLLLDGVPRQTWAHRIGSQPQVIGRDERSDIRLLRAKVSRRHAEIWSTDIEIFIRDLGSRNGTLVNNVRVTTTSLFPGDSFSIGGITLRVFEIAALRSAEHETSGATTLVGPQESTDETVNFFLKRRFGDAQLTSGQLAVLKLLLRGDRESQVAQTLEVSKNTVHSRIKAIYKAFGVNSRSALMAKFIDPSFSDVDPLQETI